MERKENLDHPSGNMQIDIPWTTLPVKRLWLKGQIKLSYITELPGIFGFLGIKKHCDGGNPDK